MQVILPLKEFAAAKQRLAGVLAAAERAQLFAAMVEDVLQTLTSQAAIEHIAICSRDPAARWLANYYGVEFIDEAKLAAGNLNEAVNASVRILNIRGVADVLVVHGDLPLLSSNDVTEFLRMHDNGCASTITIAPDRRGRGTNLLAWRAVPNFVASYGDDSFRSHCVRARSLNIEPVVCDLPGARCDIDESDDLLMLLALAQSTPGCATKSLVFLHDSGIASRLFAMQDGANLPNAGGDRERA